MKKLIMYISVCALLFASCTQFNNNSSGGTPADDIYQVIFAPQDPDTGKVTAKLANGRALTVGEKVAKNTIVTFSAEPKDNYYITGWTGPAELQVATDKKSATLKITANTDVKVQFSELDIQDLIWDAHGAIADTDGKPHTLRIALTKDTVANITFFDKTGTDTDTYLGTAEYNKTSKTLKVRSTVPEEFSIKFITTPSLTPAKWKIEFAGNPHLKTSDDKNLHLKSGETEVTVKYNTLVK